MFGSAKTFLGGGLLNSIGSVQFNFFFGRSFWGEGFSSIGSVRSKMFLGAGRFHRFSSVNLFFRGGGLQFHRFGWGTVWTVWSLVGIRACEMETTFLKIKCGNFTECSSHGVSPEKRNKKTNGILGQFSPLQSPPIGSRTPLRKLPPAKLPLSFC